VLQCVAVFGFVVAARCTRDTHVTRQIVVLQGVAVCCRVLQGVAVFKSVVAACRTRDMTVTRQTTVLQCVAVYCNVLQCAEMLKSHSLGWKWRCVGVEQPSAGRLVSKSELESILPTRVNFTQKELAAFGIALAL